MEQIILTPKIPTKIGIIGTINVGKTTLANLINGHLKSLGVDSDLVDEVSRYCPLPLKESTTIDSSYWLLGSQIAHEALYLATKSFIICDRTVIDLYPFALYSYQRKQISNEQVLKNAQELQALKMLVSDYLKARPYDFLFYVPFYQEYGQSNLKTDDSGFQVAIDKIFRAFLLELQVNYYELKELNVHARLEEIIAYMNAC